MILDLPLILETRRNHALEHASIHLLSHKNPGKRMAGHSNPTGFFLLVILWSMFLHYFSIHQTNLYVMITFYDIIFDVNPMIKFQQLQMKTKMILF